MPNFSKRLPKVSPQILALILLTLLIIGAGLFVLMSEISTLPSLRKYFVSSEEKYILQSMSKLLSEEKQSDILKKTISLAKATPVIDITGCHPYPVIYANTKGERILVRNSGDSMHRILFNDGSDFSIGANQVVEIVIPNYKGQGLMYSYGCDFSKESVGIIYVL